MLFVLPNFHYKEFSNIKTGAFLVAQMVKSLPALWETQVRSLGQEDPLEILPGKFQGQRRYSPWGRKELDTTE